MSQSCRVSIGLIWKLTLGSSRCAEIVGLPLVWLSVLRMSQISAKICCIFDFYYGKDTNIAQAYKKNSAVYGHKRRKYGCVALEILIWKMFLVVIEQLS